MQKSGRQPCLCGIFYITFFGSLVIANLEVFHMNALFGGFLDQQYKGMGTEIWTLWHVTPRVDL